MTGKIETGRPARWSLLKASFAHEKRLQVLVDDRNVDPGRSPTSYPLAKAITI
jgi:hypothetical protein